MCLWQLSSYKTNSEWGNFHPMPEQSALVLIKESGWGGGSFSKQINKLSRWIFKTGQVGKQLLSLIQTVSTLCTTVLTSKLQSLSPNLLYLDVGNNFKGDSCKIEGVHCKIHQIPPVMHVLIESTIPHLLDFSPDKTCIKTESSLSWQGIICH